MFFSCRTLSLSAAGEVSKLTFGSLATFCLSTPE